MSEHRSVGDEPAEQTPISAGSPDRPSAPSPDELDPSDLLPVDRPLTVLVTPGTAADADRLREMLLGVEVLAITVARGPEGPVVDALAGAVEQLYGSDVAGVLREEPAAGTAGRLVAVPTSGAEGLPRRVLLLGTGDGSPGELRRAGRALAKACRGRETVLTNLVDGRQDAQVRAAVEGILTGGCDLQAWGTKDRSDRAPVERAMLIGDLSRSAMRLGAVHAAAKMLARDLAGMPGDVKTPTWFAAQAVALGKATGLQVQVMTTDRLQAEGFGGILAVGAGSSNPACLVRIDYVPDAASPDAASQGAAPIVLVGKGVTFDTGGLSLKPADSMASMKTDMSGAGAVLATLVACRAAGVTTAVTGLLPLAENSVGAASWRPGDVVRQYDGQLVEVRNTDAEGRMLLADALSYAASELGASTLVDVATLTGAATLGLGRGHAALLATDDTLADSLIRAGQDGDELLWRLPLVEDYRPSLDSDVADLCHIATDDVGAGAITAALFLREFTRSCRWAHLDIAGTARSDGQRHQPPKGPTGFGAGLLLHWLEGRS